jgi:hypothetical protein
MQQPEELWRSYPLDPASSASHATARQTTPAPDQGAAPSPTPAATTIAAAAATPTPAPAASPAPASGDAADGKIELPGGASITFPSGNGSEKAIAAATVSAPVGSPPAAQVDSGELSAPAGQVGLFIVLAGLLVLAMARWLLNHTWRAAASVALLLLGTVGIAVLLVQWAADLGIV